MKYPRFTQDFEQLLSEQPLCETSTPQELCRRHNIPSDPLYTWKRRYAQGKSDTEPSGEADLAARIQKPESWCGKPVLENYLLRKALQNSLKQTEKEDASLSRIALLAGDYLVRLNRGQ